MMALGGCEMNKLSKCMDNINLYEVDEKYINYLLPIVPHLFQNKKQGQQNTRKYIGVILMVNGCEYFAPLSSYKDKHRRMKESLDFLKIKNYAVINLNNMFPVPKDVYKYVDITKERNPKYRALLINEYRYIKSIKDKIRKNAVTLYNHKNEKGNATALAKRCNDFVKLEKMCKEYKMK